MNEDRNKFTLWLVSNEEYCVDGSEPFFWEESYIKSFMQHVHTYPAAPPGILLEMAYGFRERQMVAPSPRDIQTWGKNSGDWRVMVSRNRSRPLVDFCCCCPSRFTYSGRQAANSKMRVYTWQRAEGSQEMWGGVQLFGEREHFALCVLLNSNINIVFRP